jgi:uncharacterized protein GlcG (DUF336 family)
MIEVSKQGKPLNVTVITDGGKRVATIRRARAKTFLLALHTGSQPFTSAMFGTKTNCAVFTTRNKAIKEALIQIKGEQA